jgi:dCMP deaminase
LKDKHIKAFMETAQVWAKQSTATRLQVGAIAVKDNRIISIGYNGQPSGWDNNCEYASHLEDGTTQLKTKPTVLHAEMNALMKIARSTESSDGATLFITHSPCMDCAKSIFQSGIKSVFYREKYRSDDGIEFLKKCGVEVIQLV